MKKGSMLRRSGVSFRSAAEESRIEKGIDAYTPGPSKPTQHKRQAEKDQLAMEQARKTKKNRIVEYSGDEDMEQARKTRKKRIVENSVDESDKMRIMNGQSWGASEKTAVLTAASGENEPSGTDKEQTSKTVGKRKLREDATCRSTRQRRGVDKMGGVMIHRIEHK